MYLFLRCACLAIGAILIATAFKASAAEQTISQKDRAFWPASVTIKAGDTVDFVNDDDVSHNVVSTSSGHEFDLGEQKPGVGTSVTFTTPGEVEVRCLIHPRMRATIKVTK